MLGKYAVSVVLKTKKRESSAFHAQRSWNKMEGKGLNQYSLCIDLQEIIMQGGSARLLFVGWNR